MKTLGILGGGQLGRMSAIAAAQLGIRVIIFSPEPSSPAAQVSDKHICANYNDESALHAFADEVDVITYEFENVPVSCLTFLQDLKPVYPKKNILEVTQNRIHEKTWLNEHEFQTAKWRVVKTPYEIVQAMQIFHIDQAILKTAEQGYDGKGQIFIKSTDHIEEAWSEMDHSFDIIMEEVIDFEHEISVIVARSQTGHTGCYTPSLNVHENHILKTSVAPAPLPTTILKEAQNIAIRIADQQELIGVIGVEFFVTKTGKLLVNEIAPRPHNSGHWTINGCRHSQFEQHVRTVCGLPLGSFDHIYKTEMTNLLGEDVNDLDDYLKDPHTSVHIYGKEIVSEGRKMGHVTKIFPANHEFAREK